MSGMAPGSPTGAKSLARRRGLPTRAARRSRSCSWFCH